MAIVDFLASLVWEYKLFMPWFLACIAALGVLQWFNVRSGLRIERVMQRGMPLMLWFCLYWHVVIIPGWLGVWYCHRWPDKIGTDPNPAINATLDMRKMVVPMVGLHVLAIGGSLWVAKGEKRIP